MGDGGSGVDEDETRESINPREAHSEEDTGDGVASDNGEDGDNDGQVSDVGSSYSSSSIPCPHTANRAKQSKSIYLHSTCGIEAVGYKLRGMIYFAAESDNGGWYW